MGRRGWFRSLLASCWVMGALLGAPPAQSFEGTKIRFASIRYAPSGATAQDSSGQEVPLGLDRDLQAKLLQTLERARPIAGAAAEEDTWRLAT